MFAHIFISLFLILNPFAAAILPSPDKEAPKRATGYGPAPANEADGLVWQADRRLSWDDFQSEANQQEPLHAMTSTNIEVKSHCNGNQMQFDVKCVFMTKDSWSKNKLSQRLLVHEQMHFDLTEVHARQLRQALSRTAGLCGTKKNQFKAIVEDLFAEWKTEQDLYDLESNHGLNQEKQLVWEEKITRRLQKLSAFTYGTVSKN